MLRLKQDPRKIVPLKRVNVTATIRSFAADVTITQVFRNDETTPIEAVYCFPIEEQAAVYAFMARVDDREIVAQLKEKETAQKEYNEALCEGHGAYLLEQDEKSQDNFIINVGALLPGKECQIIISYVSELNLVENGTKIRFVVPTTIAPRYNPDKGRISSRTGTRFRLLQTSPSEVQNQPGWAHSVGTNFLIFRETLSGEIFRKLRQILHFWSPYTIDFRCQIEKGGVSRVSSISHPIQVDLSLEDIYVITFAQQNTYLDRDILLDIELAENRSNTIVAVESGAVMASFTPSEVDCQRLINNTEVTNDFIFVVDCSDSMVDENKIGLARQAMLLFLKSLPVNCHFNILRFGSQYQPLFKEITVVYNEENTRKAEQLTKDIRADLGGTELLCPLQWLEENPPTQGRARQIFLLTDGEISNVNQGLARTTNGRFVFIPPHSSVDVHVGEQLQKALQPCITNVQVKWHLGTVVPTSVPKKTPPVYVNDRLVVYALIEDKSAHFDHNSSVELKTEQHRLGEAKVTRIPIVNNNEMIARLAAKALILELQHSKLPSSEKKSAGSLQTRFKEHLQTIASNNEDETMKKIEKKRIIELSLKYNILSPHTAFVGIEKRRNARNADMVLREVPIQISADDQHLGVAIDSRSARANQCTVPMNRGLITNSFAACSGISRVRRSTREISMNKVMGDVAGTEKLNKDMWPTNNQDIVRHLIDKQKFDGSWDLDSASIERLTGKPLTVFQQLGNNQVLVSAIVITVLETRFASFLAMWYSVVQKARKRLVDLLGKNITKLDILLEDIRKQL